MFFDYLLPLLAMFTMLAALVVAYRSKVQTDRRRRDSRAPKSTLAPDASNH